MPRPLFAAATLFVLPIACSPAPTSPTPHQLAAPAFGSATPDPAFSALFIRTDGWTGADGAATVPLPNHRTLWLFGDSWIGPVRDHRHAKGSTMVNNTVAIQEAPDVPAGSPPPPLSFFWNNADPAHPASWAVPAQPNEWFWPSGGGITTAEPHPRLLLFMSRIARRDKSESVWNFTFRGSSLLIIPNPDDEPALWRPAQFTISTRDRGDPREVMWGAAVLPDPDDDSRILIYGIDSRSPLDRTLLLARVSLSTIERSDTWTYYHGPDSPRPRDPTSWSLSLSDATPIATNLAPELSLSYLPSLRSYLMVYSEPPLGRGILARTAPRPEGPWSPPSLLYTAPDPDPKTFTYAAKAHPELSTPDSLLVTYCVNSTDFWYMASHAEVYLQRAVRVPVASVSRP